MRVGSGSNVAPSGHATPIDPDLDAHCLRLLPEAVRRVVLYEMVGPVSALQLYKMLRVHGEAAVLAALRDLNRDKMRESFGPGHPSQRR